MVLGPASVLAAYRAGGPLNRYGTTFTRTGAAWYRNRKGLLVQEATTDVPRVTWVDLDGDGRTETPALLLERSSENDVDESQDLSDGTYWTAVGEASITADQQTGPEGTLGLADFVEDTGTSNHGVTQDASGMTASVPHALSAFYIAGTRTFAFLRMEEVASSSNNVDATFNLSTGAVTSSRENGTGSLSRTYMEDWTSVKEGLYRCVLVGEVGSDTDVKAHVKLAASANTGNYTGDGSNAYFGYAQLEDNREYASSYIAVAGNSAPVTRNADNLYWYFPTRPTKAVTVYLRFIERGTNLTANNRGLFLMGSTTFSGTPRFVVIGATDGNYRVAFVADSGTSGANFGAAPTWGDEVEIVAVSNGDGSVAAYQSINGGTVTNTADATTQTVPPDWDSPRLYLNSQGDSVAGANAFRDMVVIRGALTGSNASIMQQARRTRTAMGSAA